MKIAFFTYSRKGCETVRKIRTGFLESELRSYTMERFGESDFLPFEHPSDSFYCKLFQWADALVFVCSCGIAVREIAPHLKNKCTDPAVICTDDSGKFVIPLLSGHVGGANELAKQIAEILCATPVITTATDVNHKFSVDSWAATNGYTIDDMSVAKAVSAAVLEKSIPLVCDFPVQSDLPNGVKTGEKGELGICISWEMKTPFKQTLRLIPSVLHLGIGCRKGTTSQEISDAVNLVLDTNCIDKRAIKCVASVDLKSEEAGLLEYCKENGFLIRFYSPDELQSVKGEFSSSAFVQSITGVDNVCERAAMIDAERLIVKKTAVNGVTVAIASEKTEVCFE